MKWFGENPNLLTYLSVVVFCSWDVFLIVADSGLAPGSAYRKCQTHDFHCGSRELDPCIPKEKKCDGYVDCLSEKDEQGCSGIACRLDQFRCANQQRCIEHSQKCDYENDCGDNSDEQDCHFPVCSVAEFQCANRLCIPGAFHCDGYQNCPDGSDEVNCTVITCPDNELLCPKGGTNGGPKCIPKSKLCDGKRDCADDTDEVKECSNTLCPSLRCEYKCRNSLNGGSCYCPDGLKLFSDNRTCIDKDKCAEWGYCDQICTNTNGSYMCSCAPGYILKERNKCNAANETSLRLCFIDDKAIFSMYRSGYDRKIIANTTGGSGLDFHYNKNILFWSDTKTKRIHSQQLRNTANGISTMTDVGIALQGMWLPVAVAVDWVGNKLYVADSIGQKIDVFDIFELPVQWHAVVLSSNLTDPSDVALDPTVGYLFVADSSQVLRANMDGTSVRAIVSEGTYKASGIAVDIISKRVFWCDSLSDYIETVDYNGQRRFLVIRGQSLPSPSRLTVFEDRVYWTDDKERGAMWVNKYNNSIIVIMYKMMDIINPKAIKAVHELTQPYANNPCGHNNGGCQHMCIIKNSEENLGYRCACNIGFQLTSDKRTCNLVTEFLMYSQQRFIKGKLLNPVIEGISDAMLPVVSNRARFVGLDFDARDQYIYYSDVLQDVIYRVHLNGTSREIILGSPYEGVEGLAVDWSSKNLYYVDRRNGTLNVLSTRNVTYKRTLIKNLKRPRAVVVHPNKGYIFFSEWTQPANISRASSDGTNLTVFKNLTLGWPNGLSIDFAQDRLYWCDALLDHVQHSNLDGTDVKTVNSRLIRHPFSIVIHKDFMYITDWRLGAIIKLHKLTGDLEETFIRESQTSRLYGVKIYSEAEQNIEDIHPCWNNNGGCSKLCFAVPQSDGGGLSAKCGCPDGEMLMPDEKTCQADSNYEPLAQACPNSLDFNCSNQRCIPKSWVCDGVDDCLDNSDEEQNCTTYRKCQPNYFLCGFDASDPCVAKEKKCDGYLDCRTGKDEQGCSEIACPLDQFRCANQQRCIEHSQKCDHKNDCGDNSDEQGCNFPVCSVAEFQCANGLCIPGAFHCDGNQNCPDGSDEVNCTVITCPDNEFLCPKGGNGTNQNPKCVPKNKLCDGKKNCEGDSDEEVACSTSCPSLRCEYKCQASLTGGSCYCPDARKLASDNRTCIDRDECAEWGYCDQICTNTDGSYMCSCAPGYVLKDRNKCIAVNATSLMLFFVHDKAIFRMTPTGNVVKIVANTTGASGLDFHYNKNILFWSDTKTKRIHSQQLTNTANGISTMADVDITLPGMWLPVAVAVDWVGNKLYVADSLGQKIDIFDFPARWHAVVLSSNLTNPSDIALDPTVGYLFVADISQVVRTNMDGTNAHAIVSEAANKASGITVDIISKRVYWCDSFLKYIETVDYNGRRRFLVVRGQSVLSPARLTIFENKVYWTDDLKQGIMSVDKYANSTIQSIYKMVDIRDPKAIKAVHELAQPYVGNPCGHNNGGCQHMCIITNREENLGYRCACNIGFQLTSDKRTCNLVTEFLIYSQQQFIRGKLLNPVIEGISDAMLPVVSKRARFVGLDFDARDQHIYYSDVLQDIIYRAHRNGTSPEIVLASQNKGVEGLAVDWASKNLYYTDGRIGTLNVLSTRNVTYRRTLLKNLKRPRAIVVHPNKGYIFFSEWTQPANISRASSDGTNLTVFKNLTLGWPNGLSIDFAQDRLYWCDALLDHVQHSNLDGTDVKTINSTLIRRPFGMVIHKDFMYITDWSLNAIIKLHKLTGDLEETLIRESQTSRLYGVKIYSEAEQNIENIHPCWNDNGGCSKLCFAVPQSDGEGLSAKCGCPYGERLMSDQRTCQADSNHEPPIQACPNSWDFTCNNQRCIPKSWVCDGADDCLDNSDEEQNCTKPTCGPNQFQCKSGRCLPMTFKCDRENDCDDSSDEIGCVLVNVTCQSTHFHCDNGRCVPSSWKCDSQNDCGDGSDEGDSCPKKTCAYNQFTCPGTGHCIAQNWVCDGDDDCFDKQDEQDCPPITCQANQFKCEDLRQCVQESYRCDGIINCNDGSDELGCLMKPGV